MIHYSASWMTDCARQSVESVSYRLEDMKSGTVKVLSYHSLARHSAHFYGLDFPSFGGPMNIVRSRQEIELHCIIHGCPALVSVLCAIVLWTDPNVACEDSKVMHGKCWYHMS